MSASPGALRPRGRVKTRDLAPGETFYAVYSPTGVRIFRTRNEDEAKEITARNPDRRVYMEHTR